MSNRFKYKVDIVSDIKNVLGECPVWDSQKKLLYWVDIISKKIFAINKKDKIMSEFSLNFFVGSIVLSRNGKLVVATDKGIHFFNQETLSLKEICNPEKDIASNRFNDGKCDAAGRLWAGTTSNEEKEKVGSLYCLEGNLGCRRVLGDIIISNGITWSTDNKTMYYIDSPTRKVVAFDYDINSGEIRNKRIIIYFAEKDVFPDGMTIDIENKLWIAHWGGHKVGRWDPDSGKMIDSIDIPVKRVSSLTFGGDNLDELFITTAIRGFSEKKENRSSEKYGGMLFVTKTNTRGSDTCRYKT